MRQFNLASLSNQQEVLIKRYYEIHFDFSNEFRNTSVRPFLPLLFLLSNLSYQATVQRKRESMELMQSSRNLHKDDQESSMAKLARENSTIADSMRNINNLIRWVLLYLIFNICWSNNIVFNCSQAFETKSALQNQRATLGGSSGTLNNVTANVPGFGRLIDGIQNKKGKEKLVIAFVIASLTFFVIWCVFSDEILLFCLICWFFSSGGLFCVANHLSSCRLHPCIVVLIALLLLCFVCW